ncbi:unnamed protein product, partial [Sphenostylis stenocarpa]
EEIERLKIGCANLKKETSRAPKVLKLDLDSRLRDINTKMMQDDLTMTRSKKRKDDGKTIHEHSASLSELRTEKEKGISSVWSNPSKKKTEQLEGPIVYEP